MEVGEGQGNPRDITFVGKDGLDGGLEGMVIIKKGKQSNLLEVGCHCQLWGVVYDAWDGMLV